MKRLIFLLLGLFLIQISNISFAQQKYIGDQFRDPFKSYLPDVDIKNNIAPQEFKKLNLSGVIWGGGAPLAIIDGKIYAIGEDILGAKIIEINKKGVLLEYKDDTYLLKPK